jgi:sarcosine oxidase subunit beta
MSGPSKTRTEIVIIGGGIVGCASAYFLARDGHKVIVLERNPGVGQEASGVNNSGVRQQGRTKGLPMAMASVRIWAGLAEELGCNVEYRRIGNLKVRFNQPELELFEQETAWEHAHGLSESRMLTRAECLTLVPGLTDAIVGGKYCPTDGTANPMLVTPAFARAAQRLGAEIRTNTAVTGLLKHGTQVCGVTTTQGEIEAELVINVAGLWAARFNELAGFNTPICPRLVQLLITERLPHKFTPWLGFGSDAVNIVQTCAGNLLLGTHKPEKMTSTWQPITEFPRVTLSSRDIIEFLPWMGEVRLLRSFSRLTELSPDWEPYLGAFPGISGYLTACGFSGQGFCLGPMVGKTVSDLVAGRQPGVSLEAFKPERFASMPWPEFSMAA